MLMTLTPACEAVTEAEAAWWRQQYCSGPAAVFDSPTKRHCEASMLRGLELRCGPTAKDSPMLNPVSVQNQKSWRRWRRWRTLIWPAIWRQRNRCCRTLARLTVLLELLKSYDPSCPTSTGLSTAQPEAMHRSTPTGPSSGATWHRGCLLSLLRNLEAFAGCTGSRPILAVARKHHHWRVTMGARWVPHGEQHCHCFLQQRRRTRGWKHPKTGNLWCGRSADIGGFISVGSSTTVAQLPQTWSLPEDQERQCLHPHIAGQTPTEMFITGHEHSGARTSSYKPLFFQHIPGFSNDWADLLSRLHQPDKRVDLPEPLLKIKQMDLMPRNQSYYRALTADSQGSRWGRQWDNALGWTDRGNVPSEAKVTCSAMSPSMWIPLCHPCWAWSTARFRWIILERGHRSLCFWWCTPIYDLFPLST